MSDNTSIPILLDADTGYGSAPRAEQTGSGSHTPRSYV